ncbi:MAG: methyltransferase domain-containing protein [Pseudomonadota bacterium]
MKRNPFTRAMGLGVVALGFAACADGNAPEAPNALAAAADNHAARAAAAVDADLRPDADRADDALRKPVNVLAFMEIEPGMRVFEMEAGNGYYTELLSALVGPDGEVVMQNPESFDAFLGDAVTERVNGRLSNVRISKSNFDALDAPDASMDVVTWVLGPHELYFELNGASLGGVEETYAEIVRILKPGGVFIVLDHAARPGAPETTGGTTHRIDPAIVKALAANAGLVLAGESDVLRNPDDNYDIGVFDPSVRRKTDRFLLKYRKPD